MGAGGRGAKPRRKETIRGYLGETTEIDRPGLRRGQVKVSHLIEVIAAAAAADFQGAVAGADVDVAAAVAEILVLDGLGNRTERPCLVGGAVECSEGLGLEALVGQETRPGRTGK